MERRHPDPLSLLHEGQTLMPKVTEVDVKKRRFLLSLRMSDCYHGDVDIGIKLLSNYLTEHQMTLDRVKERGGR